MSAVVCQTHITIETMQRITFISPQYHHLHHRPMAAVLNTYYYRNNPPNYIYKSAILSSSSSPHGSCSMFVRPDPRQFPQAGEHSILCFLHVHRRVLQSVMQLHLITRSRFSGAGPKNIFVLVVANFCYQVQDQVAKLIFWLQNWTYIFYAMKIY